jgi:hypothetical protein
MWTSKGNLDSLAEIDGWANSFVCWYFAFLIDEHLKLNCKALQLGALYVQLRSHEYETLV